MAWSGPEGFRISRQLTNGSSMVINPTYKPPLHLPPPGEYNRATHLYQRQSRTQSHSAARRIKSTNRTRDLPSCTAVHQLNASPRVQLYRKALGNDSELWLFKAIVYA